MPGLHYGLIPVLSQQSRAYNASYFTSLDMMAYSWKWISLYMPQFNYIDHGPQAYVTLCSQPVVRDDTLCADYVNELCVTSCARACTYGELFEIWLETIPTACVGRPFDLSHAFSSPTGAFPSIRHDWIRDTFAEFLTKVCPNVRVHGTSTSANDRRDLLPQKC